jgi:hypothetical protein
MKFSEYLADAATAEEKIWVIHLRRRNNLS